MEKEKEMNREIFKGGRNLNLDIGIILGRKEVENRRNGSISFVRGKRR